MSAALSKSERARRHSLSTADARTLNPKVGSENVYLFIPNIIGFSRIILAFVSLYYMPFHPKYCTITYSISCLLDAFDGWAARKFHQSTKFGAVLDMVTDRCTTGCLLCFLSAAYPSYTFVFQLLVTLDLASHYIHMYSTLNQGVTSHKKIPANQAWILRLYYGNNIVLFLFCAFNELFFVALYLLHFPPRVDSPPFFGRHWNIDFSWPMAIALISAGPCFIKQWISLVQLINASNALVELDVEERAEARRMAGLKKQ